MVFMPKITTNYAITYTNKTDYVSHNTVWYSMFSLFLNLQSQVYNTLLV